MPLTVEDRHLIGDSLQRLCRDLGARHFARPELPCAAEDFRAAAGALAGAGFLDSDGEAAGYGLWADAGDPGLTLASLATIAEANPALALRLHRAALAGDLLRRLGVAMPAAADRLTLCLHGGHGIGRGELAHWWRGQAADERLLADVFDAGAPRLALILDKTDRVACPVFAAGTLHWVLCPVRQEAADTHGLDELRHARVHPDLGEPLPAPADAAALARGLWQRDWLGLLAVQLGAARRAFALARDHAALRHQGGQRIDRHPAVQGLLGAQRSALADAGDFLARQDLSATAFGTLLLARNRLQDALAEAVNAAMQVLGGSGYMKDAGVEKCFRDLYQLRYQSGSPLEMVLLAAAWEEQS